MSRISRLVVFVTSVAAFVSAMAGAAGAVTWDVSGSGSFTATAPPGTLSSTGVNLSCATTTATGTYASGSLPGNVYGGLTGTFSNCVGGSVTTEITCGYRFTAISQPVATVATTGNVDATCGWTLAANGQKLCHIAGAPHAVYTNNPAPVLDTLTLTNSTWNVSGPSCWLGNNDTMSLSHMTFTLASPGPDITRTA